MSDRVSVGPVVIAALAVAVAIGSSLTAAYALFHGPGATTVSGPPAVASPVALQPAPERDISAYRADKQRQISEYAWVDRDRGIVRIPIERAMELRAQQARASP